MLSKKANIKGYILCDFVYMRCSEEANVQRLEVVARGWGKEKWGVIAKGYGVSSWEEENILEHSIPRIRYW